GRIHRLVKGAGAFGTRTGPDVALDSDTIGRRQHAIVRELQPPAAAFEKSGAKVYLGEARFVNAHTVQADGRQIQGDKIVIAAGSEPVVPSVPGCGLAITSDDLLFLPQFPQSLVLVGGGVIGLEMAGAFSDLGSTVTVIARDPEVLPALDGDVAAYIRKTLEGRGVTFHLGATLERLSGARGAITAHVTRDGLTHAEATRRGVKCHVARHDITGASNGRATGEDGGYLKLVFDGATEKVLGVQMVSWAAAELIQLAALAILTGASAGLLSS